MIEEARELLDGAAGNRVDVEKMVESLEQDRRKAEEAREEAERGLKEVEKVQQELKWAWNY